MAIMYLARYFTFLSIKNCMKKIYLLFLLCFLSLSGYSQITTTIYAVGASGSFKTGTATSTGTRTDGNIQANGTGTIRRGYAVFDLSTIPVGATVTNVDLGFSIAGVGAGTTAVCSTNVYQGDLSLVTVPATLYADMAVPPSVNVSTTSYGAAIGDIIQPTSAAAQAVVQANAGGFISYVWTNTGTALYTITGEGGTLTTTGGAHKPYITVTYCPPPTAVTATASPTTLCEGDNLTLTGAATGASDYAWTGPGGYTSTALNPAAFATTLASAGVYTLTAMNVCGTYTATATAITSAITINPLPAAITGASAVCNGSATTLSDATSFGNWTSSNPSTATIGLTSGTVIGMAAGAVTMTYTLGTGCYVTHPMTVNDPPGPISGPTTVCVASNITLSDAVTGGNWTSGATGIATVGLTTGVVSGVSGGMVTITYTPAGCTYATYDVSVNPLPAPIVGPGNVCVGSTITETDGTPGGTWSSSNLTVALVGSTGIVTGVSGGGANILYASPTTGCQSVKAIVVNPLPGAITGPTDVCQLGTITVGDPTPGGNFSGGAPNASVTLGGVVSGISAGSASITYTLTASGCYVTETINVDPAPAPITGVTTLCENTTTTLADADAGGTWSSASIANATVGSSSGIVSGIAAPGTTISYTLPTGCSITVPVIVNPAPTSIITASSATTFCAGGNVVLNGTIGAGLTYQWNVGGSAIAGETNATYLATTSGSYTLDITNAFNCTTTSAAQPVTAGVTAVVDYTTPLNFCIGGSIVLNANTGGATGTILYQWQRNGVDIPGATFVTYSASTSGTYRAYVNVSGGSGSCVDTSVAVNVLVNPLPSPAIAFSGTTLSTSNTYATYQWYLNTSSIPGANSYSYVPTLNGNYRVRVTDGIGCAGFSSSFPITGVGVQQVNKDDVRIFPNPATSVLHVESAGGAVKVVITGMEGKVVLSQENAKDIDISKLADGLYIVMLYNGHGERILMDKLVKE